MSSKWVFFVILLLLFSCKKKQEVDIQLMGHAGMGLSSNTANCPGNSQMAIDLALDLKEVDGMELDVRFSKDSTAWLMHDSEIGTHTNLTGCFEQYGDSELKSGRYKGGGNYPFVQLQKGQKLWKSGKRIFLDVKHYNACDDLFTAPEVMETNFMNLDLKENPQVFLLFNNLEYLRFFYFKGWKVMYSSDEKEKFESLQSELPNLYGFLVRNKVLNDSEIKRIQDKEKWLYLYDVRSKKENKEVRLTLPTGILSDDVYGSIIELKP